MDFRSLLSHARGAPLIKICGLTRAQDALACAQAGADLVGFVFHPPSPRQVASAAVREFLTPGSLRVGVFVRQGAAEILAIMAEARLDLAQLHGGQGPEVAVALGPERVIRVFWPEIHDEPGELAQALTSWSSLASAYLFDAGQGGGGHGRKLTGLNCPSPRPFFLAGGLKPSDLGTVWPGPDPLMVGLDFNSGLEKSPGVKDLAAVRELLVARAGFNRRETRL
ncbi:MAG: phosphoribosylanthranilate isomerase [Deltaproteobacteria bacterium]|jgi:phosphoribosylanthranilate isomerase|nr:phosphoribosylanthranilate isomerase [Deltaproteobacteria bacterium]